MNNNTVQIDLLPMDALTKAAACLKIMAHPIRLKIVDILMQGDFTVREIAERCGVKEHQVCEHLRLMQNCGLLSGERRGRTVHYKIVSPQLPALLGCIRQHCGSEVIR
jgi:DNA-binding transcriptional ArsR family regulator